MHDATCSDCGKKVQVNFKPDGVRPVYCPDCLARAREKKNEPYQPRPLPRREEKLPMPNISLDEATKRDPTPFRSKRQKREVNIQDLRKTIEESLSQKKEEPSKEENKEQSTKSGSQSA